MKLSEIINEEILNLVSEGDYFDEKLPNEVKKGLKNYVGRKVIWYGDPVKMIVVPKNNIHGMYGNVYDYDKLESVKEMIINADDYVEFECSYGLGSVVDLDNIIEHQKAVTNDRFNIDFEGHINPYTTGDSELDLYLGANYLDDLDIWGYGISADIFKFFEKHKFDLLDGKNTRESLQNEFNNLFTDEDAEEVFEQFIQLQENLVDAVNNHSGDIGKFMVQLRDAHHRVMGAIEAGEQNVCVNLVIEDIKRFSSYIKRV